MSESNKARGMSHAVGLAAGRGKAENGGMNDRMLSQRTRCLKLGRITVQLSGRCIMVGLLTASLLGCAGAPREGERPATVDAGAAGKIIVSRAKDYRTMAQAWGELTWFVSAEQGNCASMTVGQATLKPGMESLRHVHPNCDEVLHVIQGTISHSLENGQRVEMSAGDTITIPLGIAHNARNIGNDEAVMIISFSSAQRKVVNQPVN
jgi:quercetin dioxygenase-like cupin family protein